MILKILSVKPKAFTGQDGSQIDYFWCVGEKPDGISIQFGTSTNLGSKIGEKVELALLESVGADGKKRYTAQVPTGA